MKEISLTQGKVALVDDEDFEELNKVKWYAHFSGGNWYAVRSFHFNNGFKKSAIRISMHRVIKKAPPHSCIDHIDGNGLNNQKSNLRFATRKQNIENCKARGGKSKFKGVVWMERLNKWQAQVGTKKQGKRKNYYCGIYETEIDAARAYDNKAKELFGEYARLNL